MGLLGYAISMAIMAGGCGIGLKHSLQLIKQNATVISNEKALGEALPNIAYCVIGVIFISTFCTTDWQQIMATVVVFMTVLYLAGILVYATTNHTCSKVHGTILACFHAMRFTALGVALTAAVL